MAAVTWASSSPVTAVSFEPPPPPRPASPEPVAALDDELGDGAAVSALASDAAPNTIRPVAVSPAAASPIRRTDFIDFIDTSRTPVTVAPADCLRFA
jgi:hypothetical protein